MKNQFKLFLALLAMLGQLAVPVAMPEAFAADSATATVNLEGNVPAIFSMTATGVPGDVDLTPGASISNRVMTILHFRYNENVSTLAVSSNAGNFTPGGVAATALIAYPFSSEPAFSAIGGGAACSTIGAGTLFSAQTTPALFNAQAAGTDFSAAGAKALTVGIDEYCPIAVSWTTQVAGALPLAGVYSMDLTFTFTSQ